ncbi:hypothetical protein PQX77_008617 [Marasmius sp. AFHP31]|nr:hypothetical protein PQX77_008617 [Marasmius sp. AFHP31]
MVQQWIKKRHSEAQELFDSLGGREDQERIMGCWYTWAKESIKDTMPKSIAQIAPRSATVLSSHASLPKRPLELNPHSRGVEEATKRPRL